MGKRLCLTFSVYYFVHPYNITALMICQHVFLNIYIFYRKIVTENGVNSNENSADPMYNLQLLCEEVCPQHIKIRDEPEKVAAELLG